MITSLIFNPDVTKEGWVNIFSAMVTRIDNNGVNCLPVPKFSC